jgi:hypothetical protein
VIFGVALGVKHNAWLMPFFLAVHYLWMRRGDLRRLRPPRVPLAFVSMAVLGPILFFLHWPWLWHHPIARTRSYVLRHLEHEHYNFEYLGLNWNLPPTDWDLKLLRTTFPFVSTGLTVPVTTLGLAVLGGLVLLGRRRKDTATEDDQRLWAPAIVADAPVSPVPLADATIPTLRPSWLRPGADVDRAPGAFIAAQIFGPMVIIALPSTPIFGGVKHFMPAMPYLALSAAIGLGFACDRLSGARAARRPRRGAGVLAAALSALVCLPAVVETERSRPDGLSHYNMIAGGFSGGASLGMNRQFWAYCVLPMLDWVNHQGPENRRMYWHDVLGDALAMYKRDGRLSLTVGDTGFGEAGVERSSMGLLVHEKHWALYEKFIWEHYGTLRPTLVREREGVPLVNVYERSPRSPRSSQ